MKEKIYTESDKKEHIANAIFENNKKVFDLLKPHIEIYVTERLIDFANSLSLKNNEELEVVCIEQ